MVLRLGTGAVSVGGLVVKRAAPPKPAHGIRDFLPSELVNEPA